MPTNGEADLIWCGWGRWKYIYAAVYDGSGVRWPVPTSRDVGYKNGIGYTDFGAAKWRNQPPRP